SPALRSHSGGLLGLPDLPSQLRDPDTRAVIIADGHVVTVLRRAVLRGPAADVPHLQKSPPCALVGRCARVDCRALPGGVVLSRSVSSGTRDQRRDANGDSLAFRRNRLGMPGVDLPEALARDVVESEAPRLAGVDLARIGRGVCAQEQHTARASRPVFDHGAAVYGARDCPRLLAVLLAESPAELESADANRRDLV